MPSPQITFRIPPDLYERLVPLAEMQGESVSEFVRNFVLRSPLNKPKGE
jgi:predicted DNA-binding protein